MHSSLLELPSFNRQGRLRLVLLDSIPRALLSDHSIGRSDVIKSWDISSFISISAKLWNFPDVNRNLLFIYSERLYFQGGYQLLPWLLTKEGISDVPLEIPWIVYLAVPSKRRHSRSKYAIYAIPLPHNRTLHIGFWFNVSDVSTFPSTWASASVPDGAVFNLPRGSSTFQYVNSLTEGNSHRPSQGSCHSYCPNRFLIRKLGFRNKAHNLLRSSCNWSSFNLSRWLVMFGVWNWYGSGGSENYPGDSLVSCSGSDWRVPERKKTINRFSSLVLWSWIMHAPTIFHTETRFPGRFPVGQRNHRASGNSILHHRSGIGSPDLQPGLWLARL